MTLAFQLYSTQDDYVWCDDSFPLFLGGVATGKSHALVVRTILQAVRSPGFAMVTAPTYPMLRDATMRAFFELCPTSLIASVNRSDNVVTLHANGGTTDIAFRSTSTPDSLRGPNLSFVAMDEASVSTEEAFLVLLARLRRGERPSLFAATTPKGRNWVWRRWVEQPADGFRLFKAKMKDNPFLPQAYIDAMYSSYAGEFAAQELEGEFVAAMGLVYGGFRESVHVGDYPYKPERTVELAVDFGYANPYAVVALQQDSFGRVYVVDEIYRTRTLDEQIIEELRAKPWWGRIGAVVCDNAEPDRIERLRNLGLTQAVAGEKGASIPAGIERVRELLVVDDVLKTPRLLIDRRCESTINEFAQYAYADASASRNTNEVPVDAYNHALGALRYWVLTRHRPLTSLPARPVAVPRRRMEYDK